MGSCRILKNSKVSAFYFLIKDIVIILLYFITSLDEQINEQAFLYMPESMVKELFPVIGKRFCFLQNRKKLLHKKIVNNENEKSDLVR